MNSFLSTSVLNTDPSEFLISLILCSELQPLANFKNRGDIFSL